MSRIRTGVELCNCCENPGIWTIFWSLSWLNVSFHFEKPNSILYCQYILYSDFKKIRVIWPDWDIFSTLEYKEIFRFNGILLFSDFILKPESPGIWHITPLLLAKHSTLYLLWNLALLYSRLLSAYLKFIPE